MRLLLINANPSNFHPVFPIGLDYLSSELYRNNFEHDLVDLQFSDKSEWNTSIQNQLFKHSYEIVGVSIRNLMDDVKGGDWYLPKVKELINTIRKNISNDSIIVLGGSGLSISPREVLNYCQADAAISGDGEKGIIDLINDYAEKQVIKDRIYQSRLSKEEMWDKKFSRGHFNNINKYLDKNVIGNIQTRRGCPFNCSYCSYPVIEGSKLRLRNPENIIEEIYELKSLGFKEIYFTDSIFNIPSKYAISILTLIKKLNLKIKWHAFHEPQGITQEYLDLYKDTNQGLPPIQLTVESGSDIILESLNKNYRVKDINNAIDLCKRNGINYCFSILAGGPKETKETLAETKKLIEIGNPQNVSLFTGVCIHPNTTLAYLTKNILWHKESDLIKPVFYPLDNKTINEFVKEFKEMNSNNDSSENYNSDNYINYSNYNNYTNYNNYSTGNNKLQKHSTL